MGALPPSPRQSTGQSAASLPVTGAAGAPPRKNAVLTLDIESVNAKGFGVARTDNFVLLIDGALPGERIEARVLKVKTHYGYAKMQKILTPSPHRIKPCCPVNTTPYGASLCGGCQFQHCEYAEQLRIKKQIVTDALARIGGMENPPVVTVQGMYDDGFSNIQGMRDDGFSVMRGMRDSDSSVVCGITASAASMSPHLPPYFRYRNKAVFPVAPAFNEDGFVIGMYAARSHRIVEMNDCLIQHPAHVSVLAIVKEYMRRHNITAYDETTHTGTLRQIMVRTSLATGEIMVVLVANADRLPGETALAQALITEANATTVLINPHTARGNAVLGPRFRTMRGKGFIEEKIGEVRYRISPPSFFQVNSVQVKTLYDIALGMIFNEYAGGEKLCDKNLPGEQLSNENPLDTYKPLRILDAHAGAGGIALYAAHHAARHNIPCQITGIDIAAPAIEDAIKNAALNGITNTRFITGAAEEIIPQLLSGGYPTNDLSGEYPVNDLSGKSPINVLSDASPDLPFIPHIAVLDPPRRGCETALLDALNAARIPKIIYISCDPATLARDIKRLCAGEYALETLQPVDLFPFTGHVESVALLRCHLHGR